MKARSLILVSAKLWIEDAQSMLQRISSEICCYMNSLDPWFWYLLALESSMLCSFDAVQMLINVCLHWYWSSLIYSYTHFSQTTLGLSLSFSHTWQGPALDSAVPVKKTVVLVGGFDGQLEYHLLKYGDTSANHVQLDNVRVTCCYPWSFHDNRPPLF